MAALDELIQWADANVNTDGLNEASTRLHLIDRLVLDVLQWPRTSIKAEERADTGYVDYSLGSQGIKMILEAKREGIHFELPAGTKTGVHSIESLASGAAGKPLREAMKQVATYCAWHGVAPAAVSNGNQLVVFIAVRTDGVPPFKGRALVFPSLTDMATDFRLLWDNVSAPALQRNTVLTTLRVIAIPPPPPLATGIVGYPGIKRRNDLQAGLEILGGLFLEDVSRLEELREDFLRDCYASSGALSQYALISKQILQARYALLNAEDKRSVAPVMGKKGVSPELTQDMLAAAISKRPIVLLGDVGVGKTTFIQHLVHVDAKDIFDQSLVIYIDFGASTTLGDLRTFIVEEAVRQVLVRHEIDIEDADFVEDVYRDELKRQEKRILGRLRSVDPQAYERERLNYLQRLVNDRPSHLRASLERIRSSTRKQIVIFLDNIDQRSKEDQEQVYLIANELAQNWPGTVFVTLRPETFYASSRKGPLSAYQPRVFTISPPRTDIMLQRRVKFALHQLSEAGRLGSFPIGVTVDSESLIQFLRVLADNFENNGRLLELIDNVAGGNMRMALKFVTDFLGSGHVHTRKILDIHRDTGKYFIPIHEFLRAILFGDSNYYDPDASPIANLLRISQPDGKEHFLLPIMLTQAQVLGEQFKEEGYVAAEDLYAFCQQCGFTSDQISSALGYAVEHRLVDAVPRHSSDDVQRLYYRVTTVGAYTRGSSKSCLSR